MKTLTKLIRQALCGKLPLATARSIAPFVANTVKIMYPHVTHRWISVDTAMPPEIPENSSEWSESVRPSIVVLVHRKCGTYAAAWWSYVSNDWTTDDENASFNDVDYWHLLPELEVDKECKHRP